MINEDYCSFEVAKLLKEKGFIERSAASYDSKGELKEGYAYWNKTPIWYAAPTLQMAMKWLRKVHNIYISILPDFPSDKNYKMCWCWSVGTLHENCISTKGCQCYIETYKEATEAAIKYCLENLI